MELHFQLLIISLLSGFLVFILKRSFKNPNTLPPGPPKLPIIGNMLQLAGAGQHRVVAKLSQKYGPIMHLQLAEISAIVVSSSKVGREVLKTHDLAFASRSQIQLSKIMFEGCNDVVFSEYDDYWRQMRKICTLELLTTNKVNSFRYIREEEAWNLVEFIKMSLDSPINLTEKFSSLTNDIICRATIGERSKYQEELVQMIDVVMHLGGGFDIVDLFPSYKFLHLLSSQRSKLEKVRKQFDEICQNIIKEHQDKRTKTKNSSDGRVAGNEDLIDVLLRIQEGGGLQFPISSNDIQGIIMDMFLAGTETSSTTLGWAMSELIKNPKVLRKAQAEIRDTFKGKTKIHEQDVQQLSYVKLVVKEVLRLHPPSPLLLPKECREQCEVQGYTIPVGTKLIVNAWAIGRDPEFWDNPERFEPERFENNSIDYNGTNLNYIPFGAGRRSCPGISFGISAVELPLALLLYHFDWTMPNGLNSDALDMDEVFGATVGRKTNLCLCATPYTLDE